MFVSTNDRVLSTQPRIVFSPNNNWGVFPHSRASSCSGCGCRLPHPVDSFGPFLADAVFPALCSPAALLHIHLPPDRPSGVSGTRSRKWRSSCGQGHASGVAVGICTGTLAAFYLPRGGCHDGDLGCSCRPCVGELGGQKALFQCFPGVCSGEQVARPGPAPLALAVDMRHTMCLSRRSVIWIFGMQDFLLLGMSPNSSNELSFFVFVHISFLKTMSCYVAQADLKTCDPSASAS